MTKELFIGNVRDWQIGGIVATYISTSTTCTIQDRQHLSNVTFSSMEPSSTTVKGFLINLRTIVRTQTSRTCSQGIEVETEELNHREILRQWSELQFPTIPGILFQLGSSSQQPSQLSGFWRQRLTAMHRCDPSNTWGHVSAPLLKNPSLNGKPVATARA